MSRVKTLEALNPVTLLPAFGSERALDWVAVKEFNQGTIVRKPYGLLSDTHHTIVTATQCRV